MSSISLSLHPCNGLDQDTRTALATHLQGKESGLRDASQLKRKRRGAVRAGISMLKVDLRIYRGLYTYIRPVYMPYRVIYEFKTLYLQVLSPE